MKDLHWTPPTASPELMERAALVKSRADMLQVIRRKVQLYGPSRAGAWKGLCPFHDEQTPSFHVNPDKGYWLCFGCDAGGDVVKFVERTEGVSFEEALNILDALRIVGKILTESRGSSS